MSRDPSDNNQHLPVWLRNVPLPPRPAGTSAPAAQPSQPAWLAEPTPAAGDDVPDWLRDLGSAAPEAPESNDMPSWLANDAPNVGVSAAPSSETPDWLRESMDQEQTPPSSEAAAASGDLPDWLRQTADTSTNESDVPAWLREQMPADVPSSAPTVPSASRQAPTPPPQDVPVLEPSEGDEEEVPSWLRDIPMDEVRQVMSDEHPESEITSTPFTFEGADASTRSTQSGEVPSWLGAITDDTPAETAPSWLDTLTTQSSTPAAPEPEVPDWLRGSNAAPPSPLSTGPDSAEPEPSAPDWLRDMAPPQDASTWQPDTGSRAPNVPETSFRAQDAGVPAEPAPSEDVPSWLREMPASAPAEDVPAWMREASPSTPAPSSPPDDDIPAWLREASTNAPAAPAEEVPAWLRAAEPTAPAAPVTPASAEGVPDWLRAAEPATPAPAEGVPDWLRAAEPTASASPATPAPAEDVPDWLRAAEPTASASPATPAPAEDVPDWLRAAEPATSAPAESGGELPPWLRDVSSTDVPVTPTPVAPVEDVPDWLRSTPPATPASEPSTGANIPDWLGATQPPESAPPSPVQPVEVPPAAPAEDLPPWLRDETGTPLPTAADSNLPSWLRGAPTDEQSASATPAALERPRDLPLITDPTPAPPAWLGEEEAALTQRIESTPAAESEFLGGADLPAWLRPQEAEKPAPIDADSARSLNWLTRISPAEDESLAPEETTPSSKLALPQPPIRTAAHHQALALLERLAADPFPETAVLPKPAPVSLWQRVGMDRALYLLLLLALVLALAVPSLVASLQAAPSVPTAAPLFQQLDTLTNQDVVLVGYEWDARRVSELRPLQDAVLGHLISKGVKLVLVSTDPQGTLLSYDLRYTLAARGYAPGGSDYILLGYKPGGELALRQMAQSLPNVLASDFQGNDANIGGLANGIGTKRPLRTLRDFSAILVLADDPVDVQGWMEQVHRSAPSVPIAFMLPEETAPVTQPYMRQPNVFSLAGKAGALSYESLRGDLGPRGPALLQEAGQQRLGLLVFVVLFIIGAISVGVTNALERRRRGL